MSGEEMRSESLAELIPALIKAKLAFGPVLKDATNPAFKSKYASLDSVLDAVNPSLLASGLIIVQPTRVVLEAGKDVLRTLLFHKSGEWLASEWTLNPTAPTPQAEGSALAYGKRYAVLSLLGIAPEDDDGNAASSRRTDDEPQWVAYDDPEPYRTLIDSAGNSAELEALVPKIRAANLAHADSVALKEQYDVRAAELAPAELPL